jgi:hypothetical protein
MAFLPATIAEGEPNGLTVTATTRGVSEHFQGKLAFVYPHVDQQTRTVTIRIELDNPGHKLRPGSTATVTLKVAPGEVPALSGGIDAPEQRTMLDQGRILAIPENAVIDTGSQTVVYRQAEPGVYEGVEVKLGPRMSSPNGVIMYPVLDGLVPGELVVAGGSFLVDAETRLNPAAGSIYYGGSGGSKVGSKAGSSNVTRLRPSTPEDKGSKIEASLAKLPPADRAAAQEQRFCPVLSDSRLGSMGMPVKLSIEGQSVFLCCAGCKDKALANPDGTLAKVAQLRKAINGKSN